jgi:hypothetical protein
VRYEYREKSFVLPHGALQYVVQLNSVVTFAMNNTELAYMHTLYHKMRTITILLSGTIFNNLFIELTHFRTILYTMKQGNTVNRMEWHREVQNRGSKKTLTKNRKCDTIKGEN